MTTDTSPDGRLDLSVLDPNQDATRWAAVLEDTILRVHEALAHRRSPASVIANWTRPLLLAAGIATLLLIPVEFALEINEPEVERVNRLVALSTHLDGESLPSGADFLRALAEDRK